MKQINGIRVDVHAGDPTTTPVLLLHGFGSSPERDWSELLPALTARNVTVAVVTLPGHDGMTLADPELARPSMIAASLAEIAAECGTPGADGHAVDVVGYSLGARLAWELPARHRTVRRLVLGGLSAGDPFKDFAVDAVRAHLAGGAPPSDPLTAMITQSMIAAADDPESLLNCVDGLHREPFAPHTTLATPTLIVIGDEDEIARGSEQLTAMLPNADVAHIPGDHEGALHSREFVDLTVSFLDDRDS